MGPLNRNMKKERDGFYFILWLLQTYCLGPLSLVLSCLIGVSFLRDCPTSCLSPWPMSPSLAFQGLSVLELEEGSVFPQKANTPSPASCAGLSKLLQRKFNMCTHHTYCSNSAEGWCSEMHGASGVFARLSAPRNQQKAFVFRSRSRECGSK